jgi:hypothetical protein
MNYDQKSAFNKTFEKAVTKTIMYSFDILKAILSALKKMLKMASGKV